MPMTLGLNAHCNPISGHAEMCQSTPPTKPPKETGQAVIASAKWLSLSGAAFRADQGKMGVADLRHYAARFCEWGGGPPLVLVPGLAGNFELLGPLARELARNYRVISFQLR